eukprot:TRINITY_DN3969_c0_g1_i1.p1 TRINITY_DN3969_c0_g1~~TRINITY_DN3969_c0_g1_i1.p1  ORF type:complete len:182 (-),score=29.74 TRINITY_DN3969_c0_g1_i1:172-666(-)
MNKPQGNQRAQRNLATIVTCSSSLVFFFFVTLSTVWFVPSGLLRASAQGVECEEYPFQCCQINYTVLNLNAQGLDQYTCSYLKGVSSNFPFEGNAECLQAFTQAFCVQNIAQCCSISNSMVNKPCISLCEAANKACNYAVLGCEPTIWYPAGQCNDGTNTTAAC